MLKSSVLAAITAVLGLLASGPVLAQPAMAAAGRAVRRAMNKLQGRTT